MSELSPLVVDLALILICAGVTTLIFKRLKQPLVLGYIVAGFIASPHMPYTPSVRDVADIKIWADLGVIFLLFALGLEFSVKKLVKAGGSAIIAACSVILVMIALGVLVGMSFGWHRMDCIYLGGMLAMSSTTIIYKAFDDMGLLQQRFAGIVLSVLILEDILAIVLMVLLSTMAVSHNFEGMEMVESVGKLVFFLVLWFVVGIYVVPTFLNKVRRWLTPEMLLVVAIGMCFGMVVLAAEAGFSAAFGAFIMGSILAETVDAEAIEKLVAPVKDLFGAIFFVSVGMMVDPHMIVEYRWPILAIVLTILVGQSVFGSMGFLLSGQPLKVAMQCGFSLTQIGEFAFIIASLGVSLHVTSDFLYPIVVAVSVITTFTTPYMIRLSTPAYKWVSHRIPPKWLRLLEHYSMRSHTMANQENNWRKFLRGILRITLVYTIVTVAVIAICIKFVSPLFHEILPDFWARVAGVVLTVLAVSPFLRAIMVKKNHSIEFQALWRDSRFNRAPLLSIILFRILLAIFAVIYIISAFFRASIAIAAGVALVLVVLMISSRWLKKHSIFMERTFIQNLRVRDRYNEYMGEKQPDYASTLLTHEIHLTDVVLPADSLWAGQTLRELKWGQIYGVHVVSILRGSRRVNIPGPDERIYPDDKLQVVGTDDQLSALNRALADNVAVTTAKDWEQQEMSMKQIVIDEKSAFLNRTIRDSGIRNLYNCLVVGVEKPDGTLMTPRIDEPMTKGEVIWLVGEEKDIDSLFEKQKIDTSTN